MMRSIAFMSSAETVPSLFTSRSLDAVVNWSAIALLSLPATITIASLGYNRPVFVVSGTSEAIASQISNAKKILASVTIDLAKSS